MSMKRRDFLAAGALTLSSAAVALAQQGGGAAPARAGGGGGRGRGAIPNRDSKDDPDVQVAGPLSQRACRHDRRARRAVDRAAEDHGFECGHLQASRRVKPRRSGVAGRLERQVAEDGQHACAQYVRHGLRRRLCVDGRQCGALRDFSSRHELQSAQPSSDSAGASTEEAAARTV